ncbi:MAG: ATP synthase F1 subunit delta [Clostridia bacterium]|nr:ATP synthase F1 subunit delta [Clostridia bacterium]
MTGKNEYASAIFELALEEGIAEAVRDDLELLAHIFKENPEYSKLLDTPALSKSERLALIDESFGSLNDYVKNLVKMLSEKHLSYTVLDLISTYTSLYDSHYGIERVEAVTAVKMTEAQTDALTKKLSNMTGKKIVIKNTVDEKILGGVIIRYNAIQLDGSVKSRLDSFAEKLKNLNL